jgi:hypothetical protein
MWFRPENINERFDLYAAINTSNTEGRIFFNTTTTNRLEFFHGSTSGNIIITGTTTYNANEWYHAAISRSGSNWYLFLNGNLEGTATGSKTIVQFTNTIGARLGTLGDVMRGHIDELRISNTARYTANFTPQTEPFQNDDNTLLLLHMDGTDGSTVFTDDNGVTPNYNYGA